MNIEFMRYIDRWLGMPLCLLLSGLNFISRIMRFSFRIKSEIIAPQKILFIKLSEMGAIVLTYPLLKRIKEEYPSAEIFFLTFEKNRSIFKLLKGVVPDRNVLTIQEESFWLFLLDTFKIAGKIRKERIDIIFDLDFFSRFTAILTYVSNADVRIGFYRYTFEGLYRGNLLTHNIQYNPLIHISRLYLSLLQVVKKEKKNTPELEGIVKDKELTLPEFVSTAEIGKRVEDKLGECGANKEDRLFLINPGEGTLPLREWPSENFIVLSKKLLEDSNNRAIIIGTKDAFKKADLLFRAVNNERCINLVGQTSLLELLELFNIADALISNDCGLAHLASLTPIQKFIIFGPESPHIFSPLGKNKQIIYSGLPCSPCLSILNHRSSACKDNKCLKVIRPDDIYALIRNVLRINC